MSTTVDTKVVEMRFDNDQFEKGVKESVNTLEKLKQSIKDADGESLQGLSKSAKNVDLDSLSKSVDTLSSRFSAMGIVGMTVLSEITKSAMNAVKNFVTAVPQQIASGGWARAMNLSNAQFQLEGLGYTWDKVGKQIDNAVSGTAYSLDSAAKAASQLVATGVEVNGVGDQLEKTLTAISGVAAQTGADYDSIAHIFTTIAGNGRIMGQQLTQLSTYGLNAAAVLGKAMGKTEADIRELVSDGKISFQDFSDAMLEAFGEHAYAANNTFNGALSNMKSALNKIGAEFASPIQENMIDVFNSLRLSINKARVEVQKFAKYSLTDRAATEEAYKQAKTNVQNLNKALEEGSISAEEYKSRMRDFLATLKRTREAYIDTYSPFEKYVMLLKSFATEVIDNFDWAFLENVFSGLENIFKSLLSVLRPLGIAFKSVFNTSFNSLIANMAESFKSFTERLILSENGMSNLRAVFTAVFEVIKLVGSALKEVINVIFPGIADGSKGILGTILEGIGILSKLVIIGARWLQQLDLMPNILKTLKTVGGAVVGVLALVVEKIAEFVTKIGDLKIFDTVVNGLSIAFYNVQNSAIAFFDIFKKKLADSGISLKGINSISLALKKIPSIVKALGSAIYDFASKFKPLEKLAPIIDFIREKFQLLRDVLFGKGEGSDENLITIVDDKVPLAGEQVKGFTQTIKDFGAEIQKFFSNISLAKVLAVAFAGVLIGLGYKMIGFIGSLTYLNNKMGKFINNPLKTILGIGSTTRAGQGTILQIAEAITLLAVSLKVLASIPQDRIWDSIKAVAALSALIGTLSVVLVASKKIFTNLSLFKGDGAMDLLRDSLMLVAITAALVSLVGSLKLLEKVNVEGMLSKLTALLGIATIYTTMTVVLGKVSNSKGVLTILAAAMAMNMLAKALSKLSKIDLAGLSKEKMLYLAESAAVLAGIAIACSRMSFFGLTSLLGAFLILSQIGPLMEKISSIDFTGITDQLVEIATSMGTLILISATMAIVIAILSGKSIKAFSVGVLALAAAVAIMAKLALMFKEVSLQDMETGLVVISTFSLLVIGMSYVASMMIAKWKELISMGVMIAMFTGSIAALSLLCILMGSIDPSTLENGGIIVGSLMLLIIGFVKVTEYTTKVNMTAIMGIIISMAVMFGELIAISFLPLESVLASAGTMAGILIALGIVLALIGRTGKSYSANKMKMMIILAVQLATVALALSTLSKYNWKQLLSSAGAIAAVMAIMTGVMAIMSKCSGKSKGVGAILSMSIGLIAIAAALRIAQGVEWRAVGQLSVMLLALTAAMAALAFIGTALGPGMITASVCLIAMAGALIILSGALLIMNGVDWASVGKMAVVLTEVTLAFLLLSAIGEFLGPGMLIASAGLIAFGAACVMLGAGVMLAAIGLNIFVPAIKALSELDLNTISNSLSAFAVSLGLASAAGIASALGAIGIGLFSVAIVVLGAAFVAASALISAAVTIIGKAVEKLGEIFSSDMGKAGKDAIKGLVNGIASGLSTVAKAALTIADVFFKAFRAATGWHSPWVYMTDAGGDAVRGLNNGLNDSTLVGQAKQSASNLGTTIVNSLKSALSSIPALSGVLDTIKTKIDEVTEEMSVEGSISDWLDTKIDDLMKTTTDSIEVQDDYTSALSGTGSAMDSLGGKSSKLKDKLESIRSTVESAIDPFKLFEKTTDDEFNGWGLIERMQSQIDGVTEWSNMLSELAGRGMSQALLDYLSQLGPSGYQYVKTFYDMTAEQLAIANEKYAQIMVLDEQATAKIAEGYEKTGKWAAEGFGNGITRQGAYAIAAAGKLGDNTLAKLCEVLGIHSPSKETFKDGVYFVQGFYQGVMINSSIAEAICKAFAKRCYDEVSNKVDYSSGYGLGDNFTSGILNGLVAKTASVVTAAFNLAKAVVQGYADGQQSSSPSKEAEKLGNYFDMGIINGLKGKASEVTDTAFDMAKNVTAAVSNTLAKMDSNGEFHPTITPVLDLSEIQNGSKTMSELLNTDANARASAAYIATRMNMTGVNVGTSQPTQIVNNYNNSFSQTNNSPKALSRYDIYRQTKNLTSMMKGANA